MTARSRRVAALTATVAALGLSAATATTQAAEQPPPACFESPQFAICSDEIVPFAQYAADHPLAAVRYLVGTGVYIVCYGREDLCSID